MATGLLEIGEVMLRASERQLEVTSRNVSNISTPGYKRQISFEAAMRGADDAATTPTFTDMSSGVASTTGRTFDLAIEGAGFFAVASDHGVMRSDHDVERRSNAAYEHYRATARDRLGRRPGGLGAEPFRPPELPAGKVNTTDPDSRPIPIGFGFGFVQGYNAQAAVNEQQIVLAAEITNISTDFSQLDPMVTATLGELERSG